MNIALLSNSLINRTLMFNLEYVLNEKFENIFLPAENHHPDEMQHFGSRKNIRICYNIDEAISNGDIIIASNNFSIRCLHKSKKPIFIKNPWAEEIENMPEIENLHRPNGKPLIVILSLGRFTDQYYVEILVNKLLLESGAKIHQIYSTETRSILSTLSNHRLLNRNLLGCKSNDADVTVVSIDGTKYHNDAEFVCGLSQLSPDMLFICINRTYDSIDAIKRIAGIVCNVNLVIRSPYISYDVGTGVKYPVYCGFANDGTSVNSLDRELETHIKEQIMKSLYYPPGIVFL